VVIALPIATRPPASERTTSVKVPPTSQVSLIEEAAADDPFELMRPPP
jgi:hypothetical protein